MTLARPILLLSAALILVPTHAYASNLAVVTRSVSRENGVRVSVDVRWANAWRNQRNHDAVWLFVKYRSSPRAPWRHGRVSNIDPGATAPRVTCTPSADRVGAMCGVSATFRGDVATTVTIDLDVTNISPAERAQPTFEAVAHGTEMVFVPAGAFTIGDRDTAALAQAAFYRSDAQGNYAGTMRIESEAAIDIAARDGALFYRSANQYQGDRQGPLPADFPKGTRAFYTMKYELSQGEYAAFLNTLSQDATGFRSNTGVKGYARDRGTLRDDGGRYITDNPRRPANMISWDDGIAFADWAGLRPMTEFEFTKAARGPLDPVAGDYPWGTNSRARLLRRMTATGDLIQTAAADESRLSDATREELGASYWWVMDLAGSVWEKVVTIGHASGRAFRGTHGDGELRSYGRATNEDWPAGDLDGGGFGYRGGGHYDWETERVRDPNARVLNPHSPVSWRPYGSWGGAPRGVAYGFRGVRTADP